MSYLRHLFEAGEAAQAEVRYSVMFTSAFADALFPHLDTDAKRNLRLACKGLRDSVDNDVDNVAVVCLNAACVATSAPPPALARWAASVRKIRRLEFWDPAWLRFLTSTSLPMLTHLVLTRTRPVQPTMTLEEVGRSCYFAMHESRR